jgi:hypothetical protein
LPGNLRQWYGDSRGHWEANTLVIDVTNFSPKTDFQGSRENLHLVERWTRTGAFEFGTVRASCRSRLIWSRFTALLKRHPLPAARIVHRYTYASEALP